MNFHNYWQRSIQYISVIVSVSSSKPSPDKMPPFFMATFAEALLLLSHEIITF